MAASRQIPTSLSTPPVGGGTALDRIQEEITELWNFSRIMCQNEGYSAGNYTADVFPAMTAGLVDGMGFVFTAPATNTGSVTFDIPGASAKDIVDQSGLTLKAGAIQSGGVYELVYDASTDNFILIGNAMGLIGKRHKFISAREMYGRTTNGATAGTTETATNKVMVHTLDFDATTQEFAQFAWVPPLSYDGGHISAKFVWMHPSTTINYGVRWGLQALCISNDDPLEAAFGTADAVSDTGGTTTDVYLTSETGSITPSGTPADSDLMIMQAYRDPSHGDDTLAVDAKLIGIILFWHSDNTVEA